MNRPEIKTKKGKIYFPEEYLPLLEDYTNKLEDYCDYLESKVNKNDDLHSVILCDCGLENKNVPNDGYDYVCKCGKTLKRN